MPIGLVLQAASLAFSVVQGAKATKARKESQAISTASEKTMNKAARRKAVRELRFKKAQVIQTSENLGFEGSSLSLGAQASLAANLSNNIALQSFSQSTKEGLSNQNQKIADASSAAKTFAAFADFGQEVIDSFAD